MLVLSIDSGWYWKVEGVNGEPAGGKKTQGLHMSRPYGHGVQERLCNRFRAGSPQVRDKFVWCNVPNNTWELLTFLYVQLPKLFPRIGGELLCWSWTMKSCMPPSAICCSSLCRQITKKYRIQDRGNRVLPPDWPKTYSEILFVIYPNSTATDLYRQKGRYWNYFCWPFLGLSPRRGDSVHQ